MAIHDTVRRMKFRRARPSFADLPLRCCRPVNALAVTALIVLAALPARAQDATPPAPTLATPAESPTPTVGEVKTETLVFIRHGEKPPGDDGQLNAQGLNRALALPEVLIGKFGRADFIFAPATTKRETSHHRGTFSYVRPLMTIEPTAIRLGLPVETKFAFDEIAGLQNELCTPAYQRSTVFVAWEHHLLDELVRHLVGDYGGNASDVPEWPEEDFDSIFVVRLHTDAQGRRSVSFEHDLERLNDESTTLPGPAAKP